MGYVIKHKTGWVAAETWSKDRANLWLQNFNPNNYDDKNLKKDDFIIEEKSK